MRREITLGSEEGAEKRNEGGSGAARGEQDYLDTYL
jgi:hypothetical protein